MIVFSAIVPHPPVSIEGIGTKQQKEEICKTLASYEALREGLEKSRPEVVVIISPHAYMEEYNFLVNSDPNLQGRFNSFGLNEKDYYKNDLEVVERIEHAGVYNEFPIKPFPSYLDHGALIPLRHLLKNISPKIVHLSFSLMDFKTHYRYGQLLGNVFTGESKRIAVIASGDLSHKLKLDSPAGFSPHAVEFDRKMIWYMQSGEIVEILNMHKELATEAAECGLRSFIILFGILHDTKHKFDILSYESPFGIGYLAARLF